MAVRRVQLRRGSTNDHTNGGGFTGAVGEITVDTTTKSVRVHDGVQAGGFDLMRADMSNNLAVTGNINFTDDAHVIGGAINTVGDATHILDLGAENTTIRVRGTLSVANQTTQNDLLIENKVIVLADGDEGEPNSNDSIGILFTRTLAGGGGAQDPALFYWDEALDRFRLETNNVTEANADWRAGATGADLTLANLYATASVDVNNNNITNVGQIELDTITFADAGTVLTVNLEDGLDDKALTIKDGGNAEYLTINTNAESTTLGVPSKEIILRGNLTTLGTNSDPGVAHTLEVETTTLVAGQNLTVRAGSSSLVGDTNGGDLILSTGSGDGTGTASVQILSKVSGTDAPVEALRIHTNGYVGIGEPAPESGLHLTGNDSKAILTLENSTGGNGQDDDPTTIAFKSDGLDFASVVGAHDGVADDDKGVLILNTNDDTGLQEALRLDSTQKATFKGNVTIEGTGTNALDFTDASVKIGNALAADKTLTLGGGTVITTGDLTVEGKDVILGTDGGGATTLKAAQTAGAGNDLTISSGVGNNAGTNDGDLVLASGAQTTLTITADQKATFAGAVEIATSLDVTGGSISNVDDIAVNSISDNDGDGVDFTLSDNIPNALRIRDAGGASYLNITSTNASELLTLGQATSLSSTLSVAGLANLNGGIEIDNAGNNTNEFTVAHTSGNVLTKGTITSHGSHTIGVAGQGDPDLSVVNDAGSTTFSVTGASGNTVIEGTSSTTGIATFKDSIAIQSQPVDDYGIRFNTDRGANNVNLATYDVKVIDVFKGTGDATQGTILWDDDQASFSVTSGKLNSLTQFSVGPIAAPNFKVTPTTGVIDVLGSAPVLTLKNNTVGDGADGDPSIIKFVNDADGELARIQSSIDGGANKGDGKLVFSTGVAGAVATVLTLDHDKLATFAGNVTVSGNTVTFGNTATIVNGAADTLTLTEDNIKFAGVTHITAASGANAILYMSADASENNGDDWRLQATDGNLFSVASDISGAYQDFFSVAGNANTLLSTTTVEGLLVVKGASISGITDGDLAIASDGNLTFHIDADDDEASIFSFKVNGAVGAGTEVAQIDESGNLQIDGDLTLGGNTINSGDGTGTITLENDGSDAKIESQLTVIGDGAGTSSIVLGKNDGNNSVITTAVRSGGDNLAGNDLTIIGGASTGDSAGGSIIFKTVPAGVAGGNTNSDATTLTLDSTKQATFEGNVVIKGNLDIQQTGTNTTIDSTSLVVADPVIELARNADDAETASTDVGFVFTRGSTQHPAVIYWDEGSTKFVFATKQGAEAATTDFSAGNAPVEAQLDVGTLNADVVLVDSGDATSLVFKESDNTAYLTIDTQNDKVILNQQATLQSGSTVGNLTLSNGVISDSGASISFNGNAISTTGTADFGATTVDSLDASSGGITNAGAISGATTLATISQVTLATTADILLTDNQSTALDIRETALGSYLLFDSRDAQAQVVVNEGGVDIDFRVEGDGNANLIFARASDDRVGIKNSNPQFDLDITGTIGVSDTADLNGGIDVNGSNFTVSAAGAVLAVGSVSLTDASGGIIFNSDLTAENAEADAPMLTVERGILTNAIISWDETRDEFNVNSVSGLHLQGKAGGNALTVGGATSAAATVTVSSAGKITATQVAHDLASGTKLGNVTYNDNQIVGADDANLTLKSEQDLIFQVDSDQAGDVAGNNSFSFLNGAGAEIANLNESGNLQIDGDLTVDGGDATITAGAATAANLVFKADQGTDAGDEWQLQANTNDTFSIGNDKAVAGTYASILTLTGNGTATNTTASFAGDVELNGGDLTVKNAVATGHAVISMVADNAGAAGDTWKLDAADNTATLTVFNNISGGDVAQLTLLGDATATDGLATFAGDVKLNGSDLTVNSPDATAVINIQSSLGDADGDSWKITGSAEGVRTLTFSGQNTGDANYTNVLTLTANDSSASTKATFTGEVTISGSGTNALDFTNANTTIGNSIGNATLTLGATASTVAIPGDLKVATTKSLTLNNGVADAAADVDAYIYVDRGTDDNVAIRWDEGTNRWMHTLDGTNYYNILNANDTLFTLETDSGGGSAFTFEQTNGSTLTFTDGGNAQIVVTNNNGTVNLSLEDSFDVVRDLGVGRNLTVTGNIIGNGSRVSFNDPIVQIGDGNTSNTNDIGFYGEYLNSGGAGRFTGLLYQPENANDNGVWKLFDLHTNNIGSLDTNVTVADGELSTLDVSEVRGGSKVGVGADQAGTDLTISGGASTGNGAGGSIVFKVAEASQGAGATERLPTTTALTVNASKRVITAGDLAVGGQAVLDDSTIALGNGDATFAVTKSYHKITPDAGGNTITTITGGETGSILILQKSGGGNLILSDDSTTGTANGLALATGANITINNDYSSVTFIYNGTNWSLLSSVTVGA